MFSSFSQAQKPALVINGINLFHSPTIKLLGVSVGNKLKFVQHISEVCTRISKDIGVGKTKFQLESNLHYYQHFGAHEVRHNYNARIISNNGLNMPQNVPFVPMGWNTGVVFLDSSNQPFLNITSKSLRRQIAVHTFSR